METFIPLKNGFQIRKQTINNLNYFLLFKGELCVGSIDLDIFDNDIVKVGCLGLCEQRAYCIPHEIIEPENREADHAHKEYVGEREILERKSGWVTKTQYWHNFKLKATEEEINILKEWKQKEAFNV